MLPSSGKKKGERGQKTYLLAPLVERASHLVQVSIIRSALNMETVFLRNVNIYLRVYTVSQSRRTSSPYHLAHYNICSRNRDVK
jgi:uracil phosphoribosyltransferase